MRYAQCVSSISMKVAKWGNSLAVRLPASVVETFNLKEGDEVELATTAHRQLEISSRQAREEAIEKLRQLRRPLPPDFVFNRNDA